MSKYLIRTTEQYRVDSEAEAQALIAEAKAEKIYTVGKYSNEYKCSKAKGEIVDEWKRVTLVKDFTSEKEPECSIAIEYFSFPTVSPIHYDAKHEEVDEDKDEDEEVMF